MASEETSRGAVTQLLAEASRGNRTAFDELFPLVYAELRALAQSKLRFERDGHTLNATGLVHEAYLILVDQDRVEWQSRAHFFAVAARAMRRILLNYAKARGRQKRGGGAEPIPLERLEGAADNPLEEKEALELLALNEALEQLADFNPMGAEVIEYRFFGGLSYDEIGQVLGVSVMTVRRRWTAAKAWLGRQLAPGALEGVSARVDEASD